MLKLPPAFADLAPFTHPWVELETMESRYRARQDTPFGTLQEFYAVVAPRLPAIMQHLDVFGGGPLPLAEARLYRMVLGLIEVAQAVEFFGTSCLPGAPYPHHVTVSSGDVERPGNRHLACPDLVEHLDDLWRSRPG